MNVFVNPVMSVKNTFFPEKNQILMGYDIDTFSRVHMLTLLRNMICKQDLLQMVELQNAPL
jgi:hypothetical protein